MHPNNFTKRNDAFIFEYIFCFLSSLGAKHCISSNVDVSGSDNLFLHNLVLFNFSAPISFLIEHASCSLAPINMVTNFLHILDCSCFFHVSFIFWIVHVHASCSLAPMNMATISRGTGKTIVEFFSEILMGYMISWMFKASTQNQLEK